MSKITKKLIGLVAAMALVVTSFGTVASAAPGDEKTVRDSDLRQAGWVTEDGGYSWYKSTNVTVRPYTNAGDVRRYSLPSVFSLNDNNYVSSYYYRDNLYYIVDSVTLNNRIAPYAEVEFGVNMDKVMGKTGQLDITTSATTEKLDGTTIENASFVYTIYIKVLNEDYYYEDNRGWGTYDNGYTYEQNTAPFIIGEGYMGKSITVNLPAFPGGGYYTGVNVEGFDNVTKTIVSDVRISNGVAEIYIVNDLSDAVGKTGNVVFYKETNGSVYIFTVPITVKSFPNALVNGYGPDERDINVVEGEDLLLVFSNIEDPLKASVVWCSDKRGVALADYSRLPKLDTKGALDVSKMSPGTYYFYGQNGLGVRSGVFTLVITPAQKKPVTEDNRKLVKVYRLFNPESGEHLLTADAREVRLLTSSGGWKTEPSPGMGGGTVAVYRLFYPTTGEHLYSTDANEIKKLVENYGWKYDNNARPIFHAFISGDKPMYRLFNKNLPAVSSHHYSSDMHECKLLASNSGYTFDNYAEPVFYLQ